MWHTDHILTVPSLFSPSECQALIDQAERIGFEAASVRTREGPQMLPDIRNNERVNLDDPELAQRMFWRIGPFLSKSHVEPVLSADAAIRFYKYSASQQFRRHKDGRVTNSSGQASRFSYLVYLNEDFSGGQTVFTIVERSDGRRSEETLTIEPRTGMALVFIHDQWHAGLPVTAGVKYVLRTDLF